MESLREAGAWPDADMLPLGRIGIRAERGENRKTHFTPDEQRTLMTLWSIARSPLMFGGDLPSNDEPTLALISNDEVLKVDQLFDTSPQIAWTSDAEGSRAKYLVVFNVGDQGTAEIHVTWKELGLPRGCRAVRDLWAKNNIGKARDGFTFKIGRTPPGYTESSHVELPPA
jgi:alpha-galactosidase